MKLSSLSLVKYALAAVLTLLFGTAYSQYPATGNKQRLGWQTTGDGLVYRGAIADTSTLDPSGLNNAWMLLDTVNGSLYAYRSKAWQLVSGGGGVSMPFDSVTFNINEGDASEQELKYSAEKGYLQYGGLDSVQIPLLPGIWYVRNDDSVTVSKGMVVRATGTLGASGRIKVKRMIADGSIPAMYVLGIAMHDIASGADGYVMTQGKIRQVNTTAYSEGAVLYADVDTLGGLTQTEPGNGYLKLPIAFVVHSASNGTLAVRIDAGSSLRDLHDVDTTGKVDGSVLRYDSTAGYWKASTSPGIIGSGTTNYLPKFTAGSTVGNSPLYNVANNQFIIGHTASGTGAKNTLEIRGTGNTDFDGSKVDLYVNSSGQDYHAPIISLRRSRSATAGAFTKANDLDWLGQVIFNGADGDEYTGGALIRAIVDGTTGNNDMPASLLFATTPDGSSTQTERMRITSAGRVGIGTSTPSEALDVNGVGRFRQSGGSGGGPIEISDRKSTFNQNINWNVYYDGSNWKYRNSDFGASIGFNNSGDLLFYNIASGTAGNNVTAFRERLKINENGNIGIATASPARSLHITATDALKLPAGTTAERPSVGITGDLRMNTSPAADSLEYYNGASWVTVQDKLQNPVTGTGATNRLAKFTGTSSLGDSPIVLTGDTLITFGTAAPGLVTINTKDFPNTPTDMPYTKFKLNNGYGVSGIYMGDPTGPLSASGMAIQLTAWDGSSTPPSYLDYYSARLRMSGTGDFYIDNSTASANGNGSMTTRFTINNAGRVGIGTTSPARSLHIAATDAVRIPVGTEAQRDTGAQGDVRFNSDSTVIEFYDGTGWRKPIVTNRGDGKGANGQFYIGDASGFADISSNLFWTSGKLAVNRTLPSSASDSTLYVEGGATITTGIRSRTLTGGTAANDTLILSGTTGTSNTATRTNIGFNVGDNSATRAMTILNNGRVGIGTTTPGAGYPASINPKLHIYGGGGGIRTSFVVEDTGYTSAARFSMVNAIGSQFSIQLSSPGFTFGRQATIGTTDNTPVVLATNGTLGSGGGGSVMFRTGGFTDAQIRLEHDSIGNTIMGGRYPKNRLDVKGATVIGDSYAGVNTAPANGLLVEGKVGIGTTSPTAVLHLLAGTASANTAPLKFTSGTNLTTAEAGAVEWNGNHLYMTNGSAQRRTVNQSIRDSCLCEFTSVPANGYADIKVKVTGSVPGDVVTLGVRNAAMAADIHFFAWVHDTDSVTIRCLNNNSTTARTSNQAMMSIIVTKFNLMKHLIVLLLMFLQPFFAKAQELVKDSVWLTREAYETTDTNGRTTGLNWTFIRNTYFEFDDLSGRLEKLPIGDTAQARSALLGWQVDLVRQHSYHAVQAMKKGQVVADWQQVNAAMKANGLGGLDVAMQAAFEGQLIGDASVKIGTAAFVPADVVKNAAGNLRLLFGNVGYRLLPYADTMLRIVGYPATGQNTDLYKVKEKVYRNMDNTFILRLK